VLEATFRSGARGLVAKPAGLPALVEALRKVWRGGRYFDPRFSPKAVDGALPAKALSGRESEILALLARGLTGEEIAQRLVLSPETVRTHVRNAMGKLEARTRTEAVVKALELGEIQTA
jgi:DNA-binding NarL/FixJ family response regulator